MTFRERETTDLVSDIVAALNKHRLSVVESAYALASALRILGEVTYDKEDFSLEAVIADYSKEPSFPAALIIHADQIHAIREIFIDGKN